MKNKIVAKRLEKLASLLTDQPAVDIFMNVEYVAAELAKIAAMLK